MGNLYTDKKWNLYTENCVWYEESLGLSEPLQILITKK